MITSAEVFQTIKELSRMMLGHSPRIWFSTIYIKLSIPQDHLLLLLVELENRGLVKIHKDRLLTVSLTNYGSKAENSMGGIDSDGL